MGVSVEHFQCQALSLHVEELCDVEHSLVFFAGHSVEQNVIVWIAEEYDWVYLVEHAVHRRKSAFHLRNRLHQGGQCVAHEEHRKMLLVNLRLFFCVVQDMHECGFVLFILRIQVAVAWNVDSVDLLEQGKSFFAVEVIIDRNDADPSLL